MTIVPPIDLPPFDALASALPDDERPSVVTDRPWLYADAEHDADAASDGDSGKWLIFAPRERIDGVWGAVRTLTERGVLGPASKVSTAHANPHRSDDTHVVCVYVSDWHDTATIRRVLGFLRSAGLGDGWLNFKRDADTFAGLYKLRGDGGVATFCAPPDEVRIYTKRLGGTTWLDGSNDAEVIAAIEASGDGDQADDDWCGT